MKRGPKPRSEPVDPNEPIVRPDFILAMLNELAAGEARYGRGSWNRLRYVSREQAFYELSSHAAKLARALEANDPARIREHCADLANIAMKTEETFGPDQKPAC